MPPTRQPLQRAQEAAAQPTNTTNNDDPAELSQYQSAPAQTHAKPVSYAWTGPAQLFLISQLKVAVREGERAEAGFHKRVWDRTAAKFPEKGLMPVTKQQLKNKVDAVRSSWVFI